VVGDPTQIHQVLLNLCVNARDAMPDGGEIDILAENVTIDTPPVDVNPDAKAGNYVFLKVSDTGTGIPPEIIEKIFDPFFTTKEVGKGTGLGLSTSLAIVKSHGGFIQARSQMGKGTTFEIYLPARSDLSSSRETKTDAEPQRGNGELVLIVDDEAKVRQIMRQTLETFGYRAIVASGGDEAALIFASRHSEIDVVITDMMMPVMDGPSTIHVLRNIDPSVRITATSGVAAKDKADRLGVKYFLLKPYTAEALLAELRSILGEVS
jgi:CheY-like chemotaxis protein